MKKILKYLVMSLSMLMILFALSGCDNNSGSGQLKGNSGGSGLKPVGSESEEEDEEKDKLEKVYILKEVNESESTVVLLKVGGSYKEYTYKYTGGTVMQDRYGKTISASSLECGEVFVIELNNAGDTLKTLKESTQVWTFDDVKKFTLKLDEEILEVNGENYHLSDTTMVFLGNVLHSRYYLSEKDVLNLIGYEKELLSVIVETEHGTLMFTNTEQFQGGYFVLGNIMAGQITSETRLDVPAGSYSLSVVNKGHGGKTDVTILPGEDMVVDLSQFEGAVKKTCQVTIKPAQEGTVVMINGKEIDLTQPLILEYGVYRITATLDGYDTWSRLLMISSPEAEFVIDFGSNSSDNEEEDEDSSEDESEEDETEEDEGDSEEETEDVTDSLLDDVWDILVGGDD